MPTVEELLAMPAPSGTPEQMAAMQKAVDDAVERDYRDMVIGARASQKPSPLDYETWTPRSPRRRRRP